MGERHECCFYKNRVIERASERASEFWPIAILVSLAFTSKNDMVAWRYEIGKIFHSFAAFTREILFNTRRETSYLRSAM